MRILVFLGHPAHFFMTGRIAEYDFAPTALSRQNLLDEAVPEEKITVTGNTVIDALHWVVVKIEKR